LRLRLRLRLRLACLPRGRHHGGQRREPAPAPRPPATHLSQPPAPAGPPLFPRSRDARRGTAPARAPPKRRPPRPSPSPAAGKHAPHRPPRTKDTHRAPRAPLCPLRRFALLCRFALLRRFARRQPERESRLTRKLFPAGKKNVLYARFSYPIKNSYALSRAHRQIPDTDIMKCQALWTSRPGGQVFHPSERALAEVFRSPRLFRPPGVLARQRLKAPPERGSAGP
jgi:hypothetical protein